MKNLIKFLVELLFLSGCMDNQKVMKENRLSKI